jgi:hypothetical protein
LVGVEEDVIGRIFSMFQVSLKLVGENEACGVVKSLTEVVDEEPEPHPCTREFKLGTKKAFM